MIQGGTDGIHSFGFFGAAEAADKDAAANLPCSIQIQGSLFLRPDRRNQVLRNHQLF